MDERLAHGNDELELEHLAPERHAFPEAGLYTEPNLARYHRPTGHPLPFVLHKDGGGTERARLACGYLGCDARPFNPLLDVLPAVVHARG